MGQLQLSRALNNAGMAEAQNRKQVRVLSNLLLNWGSSEEASMIIKHHQLAKVSELDCDCTNPTHCVYWTDLTQAVTYDCKLAKFSLELENILGYIYHGYLRLVELVFLLVY
jgi:hypothetical protein